MDKMCVSACEPTKLRIMAIYDDLQALGREVVELQRVVNSKRVEYFGSQGVSAEEENRQGGIITDIELMISKIRQTVLDVREYVEIL